MIQQRAEALGRDMPLGSSMMHKLVNAHDIGMSFAVNQARSVMRDAQRVLWLVRAGDTGS